jgi:YidC/Oxa1 family membrane protein insertase
MLLQFPILYALYRTFTLTVGEAPEALVQLSERIYPWGYLQSGLPLPADFLWLHLGQPDKYILPILVGATTYILQKMTMLPPTDERQRAQAQMMNMMMPLIFGWITMTLPSGLGLYYVLSNVIGVIMQYAYVGGGAFNWRALVGLSQEPVLPNALVARQKRAEEIDRIGRPSEEPAEPASDEDSPAVRRRRRYASGRRRGRR